MRKRSGMTLVDTLAGVALSAFSIGLTVPLFRWCSVDMHAAETRATDDAIADHAIDVLRHDVWQARDIRCPNPHQVVLPTGAGTIAWDFDAAGITHRVGPTGDEQKWQSPGPGIHLVAAGPLLTVTFPARPGHPALSLGVISPASLYEESHQ
jgi:hypothetical protein